MPDQYTSKVSIIQQQRKKSLTFLKLVEKSIVLLLLLINILEIPKDLLTLNSLIKKVLKMLYF